MTAPTLGWLIVGICVMAFVALWMNQTPSCFLGSHPQERSVEYDIHL